MKKHKLDCQEVVAEFTASMNYLDSRRDAMWTERDARTANGFAASPRDLKLMMFGAWTKEDVLRAQEFADTLRERGWRPRGDGIEVTL